MTTTTTNGLANTMTSPASNDLLDIWNVAAGRLDKITRANLVGATITGGGTIATGGFTLTVPATGTAALLGTANVFTTTQSITPPNTAHGGLAINMPASTAATALGINYNAAARVTFTQQAGLSRLILNEANLGANVVGAGVFIGRNSNVGSPAAGFLRITTRGDVNEYIWPDSSADLRIGTVEPIYDNDATGTVIGTQTSMAKAKHIRGDLSPFDEVAARIRQGAEAVRRFTYRSGSFNNQEFEGVVIDHAPAYGMDRDKANPAGKSLNEINIAGDLLRFAAWAMGRIEALEAKLS